MIIIFFILICGVRFVVVVSRGSVKLIRGLLSPALSSCPEWIGTGIGEGGSLPS
jgi:hypothetical protein